jgi:hypothetical protein
MLRRSGDHFRVERQGKVRLRPKWAHKLLGDSLARFGGWRLPTDSVGTPGRARVAALMTVRSPLVWKALPTKSNSGLRKRCPGPLGLLGFPIGHRPAIGNGFITTGSPSGGWESSAAPCGPLGQRSSGCFARLRRATRASTRPAGPSAVECRAAVGGSGRDGPR